MPLQDIKTAYQQRHNLPSTYESMAPTGHETHKDKAPVVKAVTTPLQGLHRIQCKKNPDFKRNGLKSLGHLGRKCMFSDIVHATRDSTDQAASRIHANPAMPHHLEQPTRGVSCREERQLYTRWPGSSSRRLQRLRIPRPRQCRHSGPEHGLMLRHWIVRPVGVVYIAASRRAIQRQAERAYNLRSFQEQHLQEDRWRYMADPVW